MMNVRCSAVDCIQGSYEIQQNHNVVTETGFRRRDQNYIMLESIETSYTFFMIDFFSADIGFHNVVPLPRYRCCRDSF